MVFARPCKCRAPSAPIPPWRPDAERPGASRDAPGRPVVREAACRYGLVGGPLRTMPGIVPESTIVGAGEFGTPYLLSSVTYANAKPRKGVVFPSKPAIVSTPT